MTQTQVTALKRHLEGLIDRIAEREDISPDLEAIGRLQTALAGSAPFQLMHFLENRSYQKALEYLASGAVQEDPDRPDCDE